jgi:hypothetical protein
MNSYNILKRKLDRGRSLRKNTLRWEDAINMDPEEWVMIIWTTFFSTRYDGALL